MNTRNDRRTFILEVCALSTVLTSGQAFAQASGTKLDESDPQAAALGYKHDTNKVDAKKYPQHKAQQDCANCQLFQGKPTDASGGCPLFAGKQVTGGGWCSAWVKRAS